jgi:bifunctional non-homologous end joining protein LigD
MGALLVGVYETGTSSLLAESAPDSAKKLLKLLSAELNKTAVKDCPFVNLPATGRGLDPGLTAAEMKRCVWVKPIIISEVKFTEWTRDDRLRHPVFIGLREDKNPTDVVREKAS